MMLKTVGDECQIQLGRATLDGNAANVNWNNLRDYGGKVEFGPYVHLCGSVYEVTTTVNRTRGLIRGGHFYANVKDTDGTWWKASDDKVTKTDPAQDNNMLLICLEKTDLKPEMVNIKTGKQKRREIRKQNERDSLWKFPLNVCSAALFLQVVISTKYRCDYYWYRY